MGLKIRVSSLDQVDAKYHDLYEERDGEYVLTGVEGMKTQEDIDRIQEGARKEREDHKKTKQKYAALSGYDLDEVITKLDEYDELKAAAEGKGTSEEQVNKLVEARLKTKMAPLERELNQLRETKTELEGKVGEYTQKERIRTIHDHVRKAGEKAKLRPEAMEDALFLGERVLDVDEDGKVITKDGVGVTPGLAPDVWLTEIRPNRPHWFVESQGAGARGGTGAASGVNPWSAAGWNMTQQGQYIREHGREKADQMAKLAGTTVGGKRPEK